MLSLTAKRKKILVKGFVEEGQIEMLFLTLKQRGVMGFPCCENMGAITTLKPSGCQTGFCSLAALPVSCETNALSC